MVAKSSKSKWRTLRCIVEYRTPSAGISERDLAHFVQGVLDTEPHLQNFTESKLWAKQFTLSLAQMETRRPRRLQLAIRALDAVAARLRQL